MLFNSYEFIFAFLPAVVACFYVLGTFSRTLALQWLIAASLFFYAWWRPINVLIIAPSILINFVLAYALQRMRANDERRLASNVVLAIGIAFNILFLGYFKYKNFFAGAINDAFGTDFVLLQIILPLGISFITFQKIAFLIDVHAKRVESFTLRDYCLFVFFFPQLVAGPIVHYREMMPQFREVARFDKTHVAAGLTLFFMGLFKKVVIADGIAPHVTSIYDQAAVGENVSLLGAWIAAVGFTLQIYFDFSGYSDMALGAARLFGIRLPPNFNSPLQATNIIDFWLRWHITLTRFLTAYIYNPLALSLTRRRLAKGQAGIGGRKTTFGAFVYLLVLPTLLTMVLSGLWHGAGYTFLVWGLLHGVFLAINHGWRLARVKLGGKWSARMDLSGPVGFALTFVAVATAMVFFRSPTLSSATHIAKGLIGLNGIGVPSTLYDRLASLSGGWLSSIGVISEPWWTFRDLGVVTAWIVGLMIVVLGFPNTLNILDRFESASAPKPQPGGQLAHGPVLAWSLPWASAVFIAVVTATAIIHLGGPSEFLYWQF